MNRSKTTQKGIAGEEIALRFLERKGYSLIERNFRKPWGEIDLILTKDSIVHFVEVKTVERSISSQISREIDYRPEEMVTPGKLQKVVRTAMLYMESRRDEREYQIDVVGVIMDADKRVARCRLFEQVLE
jgi:uncharacterized protein (TIGR00252 family)